MMTRSIKNGSSHQSAFRLSVVKPKLKNYNGQSEERKMIGSSFASDWLREWREFLLDQSQSEVKQTNAISDYCRHSIDNCLKSENLTNIYRVMVNPSLKLGRVFRISIVAAALFRSNFFEIGYPWSFSALVFFIFLFNHILKFVSETPLHFNLATDKHR